VGGFVNYPSEQRRKMNRFDEAEGESEFKYHRVWIITICILSLLCGLIWYQVARNHQVLKQSSSVESVPK